MNNSTTPPTIEPLMDSRATAKLLGISERTLWGLKDAGSIPSIRIGNLVKFDPADIREWIDTMKQGGNQ